MEILILPVDIGPRMCDEEGGGGGICFSCPEYVDGCFHLAN